ncbi:MAG: hypothetical protein JWM25_495, partial [Thermoleophilia bacterium]|nr:hypothetical protein [Thermoleophilia bacterium]
ASYRIRIAARDEAGNQSAEASVIGATSSGPPEPPTSIAVPLGPNGDTIPATWSAGSASGAVYGYDAELRSIGDSTLVARRLTGRALTFTNLASGTSYRVRVRTVAENGDVSVWRTSTTVVTPGKLAEDTTVGGGELPVATASLVRRGFTTLTFGWASSGEAASYDVVLSTSSGAQVKRLAGTTLAGGTFAGLVPGRTYQLQVTPRRGDGARGVSGSTTGATLADTVKPGSVRVTGAAKGSRNWTIRWGAARDNVGAARYEVQRKVGRAWRTVARPGATSRAATIAKVPRGATALRVRAVDVAGNAGAWAGYTARRR